MSNFAIRVENLSKQYRIGQRESYKTLKDSLTHVAKRPFQIIHSFVSGDNTRRPTNETIWALDDVSFEVKPGEIVGIIGRNGAGKSTLLKILSRITEPTKGRVEGYGRVGSLLEVGTGFHPELTGRENIYLNGSILGMSKAGIEKKFDEIVAFAEIDKFLDTPVKRYSSGMYVRLAFAVAAHLEPEILIVDEVLAVGDVQFQKKCLGKMQDISKNGSRTVLFVSHNIAAINSLCDTAIMFESGKLRLKGPVRQVTEKYLSIDPRIVDFSTITFERPANNPLWIESATILSNGLPSNQIYMGSTLSIEVTFNSATSFRNPKIGYVIFSSQGEPILSATNHYQKSDLEDIQTQSGTIRCQIGPVPLMAGNYYIALWLSRGTEDYHVIEKALSFEVIEQDLWGNGKTPSKTMSFLWWPTDFQLLTK